MWARPVRGGVMLTMASCKADSGHSPKCSGLGLFGRVERCEAVASEQSLFGKFSTAIL